MSSAAPAADAASTSPIPVPNLSNGSHNDSRVKHSGKRAEYLNWDDYFMATAVLSAQRSKDPNTQVGACIVDSEQRIVAIGYNGFPRACNDDVFSWRKHAQHVADSDSDSDSLEDKSLYVVHAEANAILNKNAASLSGTRLYATLFPCNECAKLIIQSGIREVFYLADTKAKKRQYRASKRMFDAAGVAYRRFKPTQQQIVINLQ